MICKYFGLSFFHLVIRFLDLSFNFQFKFGFVFWFPAMHLLSCTLNSIELNSWCTTFNSLKYQLTFYSKNLMFSQSYCRIVYVTNRFAMKSKSKPTCSVYNIIVSKIEQTLMYYVRIGMYTRLLNTMYITCSYAI